jgi:glycosyltransferase involved in cell wall biosynthesis
MFIPLIRRCDKFIANSRNTAQLAGDLGIAPASIEILHPGVTMPAPEIPTASPPFRKQLNACDKTILLSVGRIHPRKGLSAFIKRAMPRLAEQIPNLMLVLIGAEPQRSLKSSGGVAARPGSGQIDWSRAAHRDPGGRWMTRPLHRPIAKAICSYFQFSICREMSRVLAWSPWKPPRTDC